MKKENIEGSELIGVLNNLFEKSYTGVINAFSNDSNSKTKIFIKDGQIAHAKTSSMKTRIGNLMIKKGIITQNELKTALKLQKENPKRPLLGSVLVSLGSISERVIPNLLFHQIEIVIYELLLSKNINFEFIKTDINKDPDYRIPLSDNYRVVGTDMSKLINSKTFIEKISYNLQELIEIKNKIIDTDVIPKRIQKSYPQQLTFDQRKILRGVDNKNTIHDIIILSDLDYYKTYKYLYHFAKEKIIQIPNLKLEDNKSLRDTATMKVSSRWKNILEVELSEENKEIPEETKTTTLEIEEKKNLAKYLRMIEKYKAEIRDLKLKINQHENSSFVLSDKINERINKLAYHKKVLLGNTITNILDMIE